MDNYCGLSSFKLNIDLYKIDLSWLLLLLNNKIFKETQKNNTKKKLILLEFQ